MKRAVFTTLIFAMMLTGVAVAAGQSYDSENLAQPDAPVQVVGCSANQIRDRRGRNVRENASFTVTGSTTATAVRIGWAFVDVLGGRSVKSVVFTGSFAPGARIDMPFYASTVGPETKKVVCYAIEASFVDGTRWRAGAAQLPGAEANPQPADYAPIPTEIVPAANAPIRFDRCLVRGTANGRLATTILFTNADARTVHRVDVDYVLYGAGGTVSYHHEWRTGEFPSGSAISGSIRFTDTTGPYTKIACALRTVTFADGSVWNGPVPAPSP